MKAARWTWWAIAIASMAPVAPAQAAGAPPPTVLVAPVRVQDVSPVYTYIGHVQAIQSVQVVPRVTAFIDSEPTPQGSAVHKGQVLILLQKSQYAAALLSAQAQLASANAALENAQLQYARAAKLHTQGFEATSDLNSATATRDQDKANVKAAEAAVAQASLNLGYCTIVAPIDGRVGAYTLTPGNLVTPSTPALTTVQQMDPIEVVFSLSDSTLAAIEQRTGATPQQLAKRVAVRLVLPDGKPYPIAGKIAFLDNQVDPQTGTIALYAYFANPDELLIPGAYVTVQLRRSKPQEKPTVPVAAVQTDQSTHYVLLVTPQNKVARQDITIGRQIAENDIVEKGLTGGERVIVEGTQKVHPGEVVTARPEAAQASGGGTQPGEAQTASSGG